MSERPTDERIERLTRPFDGHIINSFTNMTLAREVQASRKLIADLRALKPKGNPGSLHYGGSNQALLAVRRLIEEAGL